MKIENGRIYYGSSKRSAGEKAFDFFNIVFMLLLTAIYVVPILLLVNSSFTETSFLNQQGFSLIIPKFSLEYYKAIFSMESNQFVTSMLNSVLVVSSTIVIMVFTTTLAAHALSRSKLQFKKLFSFFYIIPMLFAGGTIPYYLVMNDLGLVNSLWAIILPSGVSAWYIFLAKNSFLSIPESLFESAEIDGANSFVILLKITLPLGFPIIATIILYTAVGVWNDWFQAALFLDSNHMNLWPVIAFVRRLQESPEFMQAYFGNTNLNTEGLRSATVILSLLPIVMVYPFVQRFFIKGITTGAIKE